MKKEKKSIFLRNRLSSIGVSILFIMMAISVIQTPADTSIEGSEEMIISVDFLPPVLHEHELNDTLYTKLTMPGCMNLGREIGSPNLPVHFMKIGLPPGYTLDQITYEGTSQVLDTKDIDVKNNPIVPYQSPIPITSDDVFFELNEEVYSSDDTYPVSAIHNEVISYSRGYTIVSFGIIPVKYIPSTGELYYYEQLNLSIHLTPSLSDSSLYRNTEEDARWVRQLIDNPEVIDDYQSTKDSFEYTGGLCDPSESFDYVIVTTDQNGLDDWETTPSLPYNWTSLMNKHETEKGLECTLVTVEEIQACSDYWDSNSVFNDTPALIREFLKDAYEDWGIQYVLIGGDDEIIPAREMDYDYESNVDADLYWSNLDKTFNDDQDSDWGEEGDSGFDLYSELFVGRLPCDVPQDVSNWMTKSFYYSDDTTNEFLQYAAFYGGNTGWNCEGDDFVDYSALKTTDDWLGPNPGAHGQYPSWGGTQFGFETWNLLHPDLQFNLSAKWTAEPENPGWQGGSESAAKQGLKNAINNDQVALISGIAHANSGMSLDVYSSSWESDYHNTKPFFIHDYGCHCGDIDASDGVLHSMLFHSDTELAFGCVYHTSYGWGSQDDTNSSSAIQQKLFWDYFFDVTNNSGGGLNWQLGKGHAFSKDAMAPTINWTYSGAPGSWRGTIQACLLFADPAQVIGMTQLAVSPSSLHFGLMLPNETATKTVSIWNDGAGTMSYEIIENCSWLSIDVQNGTSSGEHDQVLVTVNTTGLSPGAYHYQLPITSDGGDAFISILVMIPSGTEKVSVDQSMFNRGFPIRAAIDGDWAGAQSFHIDKDYLTRVRLYLRKFGTPEFDLSVELRQDGPEGTLLDSVTFPISDIPSTWDWFNVDFVNINTSMNTEYFIVIPPAPSGVTTSFGYEWGYAFSNQYDDGSFWFTRDGGTLWRDLPSSYEFTFQTYGVVE